MSEGSTKAVIAALAGNAAIAVTKFVAAVVTGSSAMFAEGCHSVADTGNQGLLLFGINRSEQQPDRKHPFGYGKEVYFWSFVVAIILFAIGAGVSAYEGVHKLLNPHPMENAVWNYAVLGFAVLFEGFSFTFAMREFNRARGNRGLIKAVRRSKDPTLFTVLFEDSAALLGLFVAFVGVAGTDLLGLEWADGVATLFISAILAMAAVTLAIEIKGLLIGEGADPEIVDDVRELARQQMFVAAINDVRTLHFGPEDVLLNISVDAVDTTDAGQVERGVTDLERRIKDKHPLFTKIFIEVQSRQASAPTELRPTESPA